MKNKSIQTANTVHKSFIGIRLAMKYIFIILLILFTVWLLNYAWVIITTKAPAEYREGAILLMTEYFLRGSNPFSFNNQPLLNTNYGMFYSIVMLPFVAVLGNTLLIHRVISVIFIFLSGFLIFRILIKRNNDFLLAIAGCDTIIAGLLFFVGPLARPDALGVFLFLSAVLIPCFRKFDVFSLLICCVLSILSFYTKTFFFFSFVIVSCYLILFVSKKKGIWFSFFTIFFLLISSFIVSRIFPLYFHNIIFESFSSYAASLPHLWDQTYHFILIYLPCLVLLLITLKLKLPLFQKKKNSQKISQLFTVRSFYEPLLNVTLDYCIFFLFCDILLIVFFLGQHTGNYLVYFFQFITPPLIIVIFKNIKIENYLHLIAYPLILINLFILCFWVLYPNSPPPYEKEWQRINQIISESKNILNSPVLVPELIKNGITPIDSGSTQYYFNTKPYPRTYLAPDYQSVIDNGMKYYLSIKENIRTQRFDHILITRGRTPFFDIDYIKQYYAYVESFSISMPQSHQFIYLDLWDPIPTN